MTIEAATPMDRSEALRITERIRLTLDRAARSLDQLGALVAEAYQREAHRALGYDTWADYARDEFSALTLGMAAEIRRELVGRLTEAGMSTRAIAPTVGTSFQAVHQMEQRRQASTPIDTSAPDPLAEEKADGRVVKLTGPGSLLHSEPVERIDLATGEICDRPAPEPPSKPFVPGKITGADGKYYPKPTPKPTPVKRRDPLPDRFMAATHALDSKVRALVALAGDDRFPQHAERVADANLSDLIRAIDALQSVINMLNKTR